MDLKIFDQGPKIYIEDIKVVEEKYCIKFPLDYVQFVLNYNGGHFNDAYFYKGEENIVLSEFFSFKEGFNTVEGMVEMFKINKQILPEFLVPIGSDPATNILCFSTKESEFGAIYIYVDDSEFDIRYVTHSFEYLYSNLE